MNAIRKDAAKIWGRLYPEKDRLQDEANFVADGTLAPDDWVVEAYLDELWMYVRKYSHSAQTIDTTIHFDPTLSHRYAMAVEGARRARQMRTCRIRQIATTNIILADIL